MECTQDTTSSFALCTPLCSGYGIFLVFGVFVQPQIPGYFLKTFWQRSLPIYATTLMNALV